jgi:hypothetical protein
VQRGQPLKYPVVDDGEGDSAAVAAGGEHHQRQRHQRHRGHQPSHAGGLQVAWQWRRLAGRTPPTPGPPGPRRGHRRRRGQVGRPSHILSALECLSWIDVHGSRLRPDVVQIGRPWTRRSRDLSQTNPARPSDELLVSLGPVARCQVLLLGADSRRTRTIPCRAASVTSAIVSRHRLASSTTFRLAHSPSTGSKSWA